MNNILMSEFNIKEIGRAFYSYSFGRYEIVAPNIFLDWQFNEMDLLGIRRSGYIDEIEIKLSRADYLADFKKVVKIQSNYECIVSESYSHTGYYRKLKHKALNDGEAHCNYFSFLLSEDLIEKCNIPDYAGLYSANIDKNGICRIKELKPAKLLHKRRISEKMKYDIGRKMAHRFWKSSYHD